MKPGSLHGPAKVFLSSCTSLAIIQVPCDKDFNTSLVSNDHTYLETPDKTPGPDAAMVPEWPVTVR